LAIDLKPIPPPIETVMTDQNGIVTPPWANFFNNIYRFQVYTAPDYIRPSSVTLNTGGSTSSLSDLQTLLDGNTYDIDEVTGVGAINLEIAFTNIKYIKHVWVSLWYEGSATHAIRIQMYNYDTTDWDTFHTVSTTLDYELHTVPIIQDTNYISGGNAIVRLYHTESGNASHDLYIDYVGIGH